MSATCWLLDLSIVFLGNPLCCSNGFLVMAEEVLTAFKLSAQHRIANLAAKGLGPMLSTCSSLTTSVQRLDSELASRGIASCRSIPSGMPCLNKDFAVLNMQEDKGMHPCEHASLQCQIVGVAVINGCLNVLHSDDWYNWPKWLLPCYSHVLPKALQGGISDTLHLPGLLSIQASYALDNQGK